MVCVSAEGLSFPLFLAFDFAMAGFDLTFSFKAKPEQDGQQIADNRKSVGDGNGPCGKQNTIKHPETVPDEQYKWHEGRDAFGISFTDDFDYLW